MNSGVDVIPLHSCSDITTPLCLQAWIIALSQFLDKWLVSFLLNGISNGFPIGAVISAVVLKSAHHNLPSAAEHPNAVDSYISSEVAELRIQGPVPHLPQIHISPMGIIPKPRQPEKWRLITDLSFPKGKSINDAIAPQLCSLHYSRVDHVAQLVRSLGKGTFLAKLDLKSAYQVVPVSEDYLSPG